MYPDVFKIASQIPGIGALLGSTPLRFWPFEKAPGPNEPGYGVPYATHYLPYGSAENNLSAPAEMDTFAVQFDVFAGSASQARQVAKTLRDAFEAGHGYVIGYNGESWEQGTGLYRLTFTMEFWESRS